MNLTKFKPRYDTRSIFDRFKVGRTVPVQAVPVRVNESGVLSQSLRLELDPIPGRLITPIHAEVYVVYVPAQAIDALNDPESDYVGVTEVMRQRFLSGNPLYTLENENEISMRCGIQPVSIGGVKKVCPSIRLAYICAVNHLLLRLYKKAVQYDKLFTGTRPALLSSTILDRLSGVLDPDDRINGNIAFELPEKDLRVKGLGVSAKTVPFTAGTIWETGDQSHTAAHYTRASGTSPHVMVEQNAAGVPQIFAEFADVQSQGISFTDFYNAQMKDKFVRDMDAVIKANPQYGEEMVLRMVHGLQVDTGKTAMLLHSERVTFGGGVAKASDGAGIMDDTMRSDAVAQVSYSLPVPRTELGGVIVTLVMVKPDEVLPPQPHPLGAYPWVADNFVADELQLDPVPVTLRDLYSDCDSGHENNIMFYTGLNQRLKNYQHYGISRRLDPMLVDNKMLIYQYQIPTSVTPLNLVYPGAFSQHIFADPTAEVVACFTNSSFAAQTMTVFGPTPRETVEIIDDLDIFEEEE